MPPYDDESSDDECLKKVDQWRLERIRKKTAYDDPAPPSSPVPGSLAITVEHIVTLALSKTRCETETKIVLYDAHFRESIAQAESRVKEAHMEHISAMIKAGPGQESDTESDTDSE